MGADRKQQHTPLTRLELDIMRVLWRQGSATVQQVLDAWETRQKPAYTTVQTILTILYRKRKVTRTMEGKAYRYAPKVTEKTAMSTAVRDMIHRFFGGSAEGLVMSLIQDRQLSTEKLAKLARLVEKSERNERKRES